jgi:tetratricopeptide (TPR) repeat protein
MKKKLVLAVAAIFLLAGVLSSPCMFAQSSAQPAPTPTLSKEQIEEIKAQNAKAVSLNALIAQAQTAMNAKDWQAAISPLQQLVAADPSRWESFQALGNVQLNLGQYQDALQSYDKGIKVAQSALSGVNPKDPNHQNADQAQNKLGLAQMLTNAGNAYLKLHKYDEALDAYTKAAALSSNPGTAYFNLCATAYNTGKFDTALRACDNALANDPKKADTWFIKGSIMYGNGKLDANNKYIVPPGTIEALSKYLELAPDGGHAADVKTMLEEVGKRVDTTYGTAKKQ